MSLSSLRSLNGAASLATTAFDTARSTLKAMAEAAVPPTSEGTAEAATTAGPGGDDATPKRAPEGLATASERKPADSPSPAKAKRGIRKGTVLDAYA